MRKGNLFVMAAAFTSFFVSGRAWAQYPQLTSGAGQAHQKIRKKLCARSDLVWAVAYPIVMKEAQNSRPYVPWAGRPYDLPQAKVPAFPGTERGGMYSFGGRGGKAITITNLSSAGPGSFREACGTGDVRVIVFNVTGVIKLKTPITVHASYVTTAGQTAPGDGICMTGKSFWVETHGVVVRHIRFRRGETNVYHRDDPFGSNPVGSTMISHYSCVWELNENVSFYRRMFDKSEGQYEMKAKKLSTVNVTIQNAVLAKALDTYNHAFGSILDGENCALAYNLWASNSGRNPSIGWNGIFSFVNSIVFSQVHRLSDGGNYTATLDMINNYYRPGPATPKDTSVGHRILKPEADRSKLDHKVYGRIYAAGNIMEGCPKITKDNWKGGIQIEETNDVKGHEGYVRQYEPFMMPYVNVPSAKSAYNFVLRNMGITLPCRDIIDQRTVEEVITGVPYVDPSYTDKKKMRRLPEDAFGCKQGLSPESQNGGGLFKYRRLSEDSYKIDVITHPNQVGEYPEYKGTPYVDTDKDGMPNEWEKANGLNPNDASDVNEDCIEDGYTNTEKYINGISTVNHTNWANLNNNYDMLAEKERLM